MFIVEGTYRKKKLPSGACFILGEDYYTKEPVLFGGPDDLNLKLKNSLVAVDVVAQEQASGGGVQGAAGGAVLGFLIAGPLGTAVGAGMGSKKKGRDNTVLAITWANGDVWVVDRVKTKELAALKVALATSAPKKNSRNSQTRKKSPKKVSYEDQIRSKKPKLPPSWDLTLSKGRSTKDKTTLPSISRIEELKKLDGHAMAIEIFRKTFTEEIENYNNWKWQYFDLKIEIDEEINAIAQNTIKRLIVVFNEAAKVKDNSADIELEIEKLSESVELHKSEISTKTIELEQAGFFGKGSIKQKIKNSEIRLKQSKAKLSKARGSLTSLKKKLASFNKLQSTDKGNEILAEIYRDTFPNEKKPPKTLKSKISFDHDLFYGIYKKVFDETWDKKIKLEIDEYVEQESRKKQSLKSEEKNISEPKLTKKDKLIELQELFDESLITKEEFEASRKRILGLD